MHHGHHCKNRYNTTKILFRLTRSKRVVLGWKSQQPRNLSCVRVIRHRQNSATILLTGKTRMLMSGMQCFNTRWRWPTANSNSTSRGSLRLAGVMGGNWTKLWSRKWTATKRLAARRWITTKKTFNQSTQLMRMRWKVIMTKRSSCRRRTGLPGWRPKGRKRMHLIGKTRLGRPKMLSLSQVMCSGNFVKNSRKPVCASRWKSA